MNIVLMTSRSGSSLVCKVLAMHGLTWQWNNSNPEQPAAGDSASYRTFEHPEWKRGMKLVSPNQKWPMGVFVPVTKQRLHQLQWYWDRLPKVDFVKMGVEFAPLWSALGDANNEPINFICVRRPAEDIGASLERRGVGRASVGIEVAKKRFDLMDMTSGVNVHTNLLVSPDPNVRRKSGIFKALEQCGVTPQSGLIKQAIERDKFHV